MEAGGSVPAEQPLHPQPLSSPGSGVGGLPIAVGMTSGGKLNAGFEFVDVSCEGVDVVVSFGIVGNPASCDAGTANE